MKNIISLLFLLFISCGKKEKKQEQVDADPIFHIEKIVVINMPEGNKMSFKVKVTNPNDKPLIFLDNNFRNISEAERPSKKGFYLRNLKNDSIKTLGITYDNFYGIDARKSRYFFMGIRFYKNSYDEKDSLLLKKSLLNYRIEYNGTKLDFNKIKKDDYIPDIVIDNFKKNMHNYIPCKDSIIVGGDLNKLKIKYLNYVPIQQDEWDKL